MKVWIGLAFRSRGRKVVYDRTFLGEMTQSQLCSSTCLMSPVQYDDGIVGAVRGHLIHVLLLAGLRCTGKVEHDYAPFTIYGICGQTWHPLYHLGLARRLPLWAVLEPPTRRATWPACWPPPTSCSPARGCATRLISWGEVGTGAFLLLRAALTRILVGPRVLAWCGEGAGSWEGSNCKSLIFAPFFSWPLWQVKNSHH